MKKKIYRFFKDIHFKFRIKNKKINVLWYPKISREEDLKREMARMIWYLNPIKDNINKISLIISDDLYENLIRLNNISFPEYVDVNIQKFYDDFYFKLNFLTSNNINMKSYDTIIQWFNDKKEQLKIKKIYPYYIDASINENQFEANQIAKFSSIFLSKNEIKYNNKKLKQILLKIKHQNKDNVYLFGSGPSIKCINHKNINFSNSISIICNSVVKNINLLRKINPKIMVATDSVFHSGYSKYAEEFRKNLILAMEKFQDMYFFVPMRDLLLYKKNLPFKYNDRIIGIQAKKIKSYNINLIQKNYVKSTSNVLTFFLIPIAATISDKIRLVGFDGRDNDDKNIFWKYDKDSQFINSISYTKLAHPSFYKVDYNQYFFKHCMETENLIKILEKTSIKLEVIGNTNIPALKRFIIND